MSSFDFAEAVKARDAEVSEALRELREQGTEADLGSVLSAMKAYLVGIELLQAARGDAEASEIERLFGGLRSSLDGVVPGRLRSALESWFELVESCIRRGRACATELEQFQRRN